MSAAIPTRPSPKPYDRSTGHGGRIAIRIHGTPVPQGSKTANSFGRGVRDANATKLKPWREHVTAIAADATRFHDTITGPVRVWVRFTFERPKSHYRSGRNSHRLKDNAPAQPTSKNDVDKLQRAVFDALTDAAVWADDGQVVDVRARKFYAGEHEYALHAAGVDIIIEELA